MTSQPLFCVENLRVAYPNSSQWAVDRVSLSLNPGQKLGLIGESGCGKSTLGRAAMDLLPAACRLEGEITFAGKPVFGLKAEELRQFRGEVVALIFQDPMTRLDPLMTIGEHCLETLQSHQPNLSRRQAKEKAIATLERVKIPASRWGQYPHEFSGGMRQRVAIALALLLSPQLIVADEPTTSLDVTIAAEILQELTRLCEEDRMALLLISHDLAMVSQYCDRLAVMYGGQIVEMGEVRSILTRPQHDYTQSLLRSALHLQVQPPSREETPVNLPVQPPSGEEKSGEGSSPASLPLLRVQDLKQHFTLEGNLLQQWLGKEKVKIKAVDGVSFDLYAGETLGLVGESGCGKSTLSRTILQLLRPSGGRVQFLGEDLTQLSDRQMRRKRRQMQMIFQDPRACLNPLIAVGDSIAEPLVIHQLGKPAEVKRRVEAMLERVGLTPVADYYYRYPADLSGGQQQRVAIARALITNPQLVICDEPVSMLDASIQAQVLELMAQLKEEFHLTYLFITHDLWVARFFCDRIAVMNGGQIVEIGETEGIFTHPQHPYTQKLLKAAPLLQSTVNAPKSI